MSEDEDLNIFIHQVLIGELYYDLSYDSVAEDRTAVVVCQSYDENTNYPDLTSVIIPPYVTYDGEEYRVVRIDGYTFANCNNLTSVVLPDTITKIEAYAFWCCHALNSISILHSVICIGESAFAFCENLTTVVLPDSVTCIGSRAFEDSPLSAISFPDSITKLGNSAFYCSLIPVYNHHMFAALPLSYTGEFVIPQGVKIIAGSAFHLHKKLSSVIIPESVTYIGEEAFKECNGLTSLTCKATIPPTLGEEVFGFINKSIPLYIPAESVELYKSAPQWQQLTNIQPIAK